MIERKPFGEYELITIQNEHLKVSITSLGATIQELCVEGENMILGFHTPEEYLNAEGYIGAIVGRYANRIKDAKFTLNGIEYQLTANEKKNQLHGGNDAFDKKCWDVEIVDDETVQFSLFSEDGENGFPGNLHTKVTYHINDYQLRIDFEGSSDQDTIFAPTTHMYFTLGSKDTILDTELMIDADYYLPVDEENIPLEKKECLGEFDFRKPRLINQDYDHCFILKNEYALTARRNNITLDVFTNYPGIQLYTGTFLTNGFHKNEGFAIEPEFFPNTPNRSDFPSCVLRKGETYHKYVLYKFKK